MPNNKPNDAAAAAFYGYRISISGGESERETDFDREIVPQRYINKASPRNYQQARETVGQRERERNLIMQGQNEQRR